MGNEHNNLNRRRFLVALGAAAGIALTPVVGIEKAFAVARDYARKPGSQRSAGIFFSKQEFHVLRTICDLVIPRTETPGAVDVDVHGFVDNQIVHCHSGEEQRGAKSALAAIERIAQSQYLRSFKDCTEEQQLAILFGIESQTGDLEAEEFDGFRFLKGMIVFGYFTSEVGATQELAYDAYPGRFVGSVPYSDIGRAWYKG